MSGAWVSYVEARSTQPKAGPPYEKRLLWRELDAGVKGWRSAGGARVELDDAEVLRGSFDVTIVVRSPDVARRRLALARAADARAA